MLEGIDLAGAKGVLVNVTAGVDLSLGEFEEVGETIRQFASDDATVVVGTVIDSDMSDELRVTVVATGLGEAAALEQGDENERPQIRIVKRTGTGEPNYADYERPTVQRNQAGEEDAPSADKPMEQLLNVPAFLRRQAD